MDSDDLNYVLFWLDPKKNPALVQLPVHEYSELQKMWDLPEVAEHET